MSVSVARHVPVAVVDSGEEQFLEESRLIAESFLHLCFLSEDAKQKLLLEKSPDGEANLAVASNGTKQLNDNAIAVADRLRTLGDKIDDRIKAELAGAMKDLCQGSVWDISYQHFDHALRGVLVRFQGAVSSGWEQVSIVYEGVSHVVSQLREHGHGVDVGPRERHMLNFAGFFMRDNGLQEWVENQGGLVHAGDAPTDGTRVVPIRESDV